MSFYPDSTFFVAYRVESDTFHAAAWRFFGPRQQDTWFWSPWHRIEVFNTIRSLTLHPDKARRLSMTEAKGLIRHIEADVRAGYFEHGEPDWRDVLRIANEISAEQALKIPCRSADLLHIAYAIELGADTFASFDSDQLALAKAAGLHAPSLV